MARVRKFEFHPRAFAVGIPLVSTPLVLVVGAQYYGSQVCSTFLYIAGCAQQNTSDLDHRLWMIISEAPEKTR